MKTINVEIKGTSPLLMNKYNIEAELDRQKGRRTTKKYVAEEEAEKGAYWMSHTKKKELMIPAIVLYASLLNASSFYRIAKRSAKSILAGSIKIEPMEIGLGTDKYQLDIRPVVIQRNKVLKGRARLDEWKASFKIIYDERLIADPTIIKDVLTDAGMRIGICDFRPSKGGPYGCFEVLKFEVPK